MVRLIAPPAPTTSADMQRLDLMRQIAGLDAASPRKALLESQLARWNVLYPPEKEVPTEVGSEPTGIRNEQE